MGNRVEKLLWRLAILLQQKEWQWQNCKGVPVMQVKKFISQVYPRQDNRDIGKTSYFIWFMTM